MHESIRELMRLKIRSKIYSVFLGIGVIAITFAIIIGLGMEDPMTFGNHFLLISAGCISTLVGLILYQNEERFAQKYDMTHYLISMTKKHDMKHISNICLIGLPQISTKSTQPERGGPIHRGQIGVKPISNWAMSQVGEMP